MCSKLYIAWEEASLRMRGGLSWEEHISRQTVPYSCRAISGIFVIHFSVQAHLYCGASVMMWSCVDPLKTKACFFTVGISIQEPRFPSCPKNAVALLSYYCLQQMQIFSNITAELLLELLFRLNLYFIWGVCAEKLSLILVACCRDEEKMSNFLNLLVKTFSPQELTFCYLKKSTSQLFHWEERTINCSLLMTRIYESLSVHWWTGETTRFHSVFL